jgi:Phosphotransferase enzyme family.
MKSKTKNVLSNDTIKKCFLKAGFSSVSNIAPLGAGMYNSVYSVTADGKEYAIKIAPPDDVEVMRYEKDMMAVEVYWYKQMKEKTCIQVPEVFFYDTSKSIIPSEYFIMEKIDGEQVDKIEMTAEEKAGLNIEMAKMAAEMHKVKNDKFGYIQTGLFDNWYQAIRASVQALIDDATAKGKKPKEEKSCYRISTRTRVFWKRSIAVWSTMIFGHLIFWLAAKTEY